MSAVKNPAHVLAIAAAVSGVRAVRTRSWLFKPQVKWLTGPAVNRYERDQLGLAEWAQGSSPAGLWLVVVEGRVVSQTRARHRCRVVVDSGRDLRNVGDATRHMTVYRQSVRELRRESQALPSSGSRIVNVLPSGTPTRGRGQRPCPWRRRSDRFVPAGPSRTPAWPCSVPPSSVRVPTEKGAGAPVLLHVPTTVSAPSGS